MADWAVTPEPIIRSIPAGMSKFETMLVPKQRRLNAAFDLYRSRPGVSKFSWAGFPLEGFSRLASRLREQFLSQADCDSVRLTRLNLRYE